MPDGNLPLQFEIQTRSLLKGLNSVRGATVRGGAMPVLSRILLEAFPGFFRESATNLEMEMQSELGMQSTVTGGSGDLAKVILPAQRLHSLLESLPKDALLRVEVNTARVTVHYPHGRFTFPTLPADEFPEIGGMEAAQTFDLEAAKLRAIVQQAACSMPKSDARPFLNGMLLEFRNGSLRCVASNGHRLSLASTPLPNARAGTKVLIPTKAIEEIKKMLAEEQETVHIECSAKRLKLRTCGVVLTCNALPETFPDYEPQLPRALPMAMDMDRIEALEAVRRATILADPIHQGVRLCQGDAGTLSITTAAHADGDAAEELVAVEFLTPDTSRHMTVRANYLSDALAALTGERVTLEMRDEVSPCTLHEVGTLNPLHVIMPMRD